MKLGVFTVLFGEKSFEEMLDYVSDAGLEAIEIGTGVTQVMHTLSLINY